MEWLLFELVGYGSQGKITNGNGFTTDCTDWIGYGSSEINRLIADSADWRTDTATTNTWGNYQDSAELQL
jgi:hypothetical protein